MRRSRPAHFLLALTLVVAHAAAGRADELDPHFAQGVRLFSRGAHAAALAEFETSRARRETARVVFNIGACRVALSRWSEAAADFDRFVELRGRSLSAAERAELRAFRSEIETHLALLTVVTVPPGAEVLVDGRRASSFPVRVDVGREVEIEARAPGRAPARRNETPRAAGAIEVRLQLPALPARGAARRLRASIATPLPETTAVATHDPLASEPAQRSRPSALPWILLAGGVVLAGGAVAATLVFGGETPLEGDLLVELP